MSLRSDNLLDIKMMQPTDLVEFRLVSTRGMGDRVDFKEDAVKAEALKLVAAGHKVIAVR